MYNSMEPMALGSPVGSPTQPQNSPGNSGYLPGFLLGDTNTPSSRVMTSETSRFGNPGPSMQKSPANNYATPEFRTNRQKAMFGGNSHVNISQTNIENQIGGPPTKSLYDSFDVKQQAPTPNASFSNQSMNQSRLLGAGFANTTVNSPFSETPINQTQNDSMQGLLQWVTVFGFPVASLNTVLSHISSRVRVVDKHPAPHQQCNWIHLKCSTEQEAQRALTCNGNIVAGSMMIGVVPCTDEGVILGGDKENRSMLNDSMRLFSTPVKPPGISGLNITRNQSRRSNARPLVSGYNQHLNPQAVRTPDNVPHKSTGIITKAMEYVFGL